VNADLHNTLSGIDVAGRLRHPFSAALRTPGGTGLRPSSEPLHVWQFRGILVAWSSSLVEYVKRGAIGEIAEVVRVAHGYLNGAEAEPSLHCRQRYALVESFACRRV
jgi:hypothetical protein